MNGIQEVGGSTPPGSTTNVLVLLKDFLHAILRN
jgi:hypothetical protein